MVRWRDFRHRPVTTPLGAGGGIPTPLGRSGLRFCDTPLCARSRFRQGLSSASGPARGAARPRPRCSCCSLLKSAAHPPKSHSSRAWRLRAQRTCRTPRSSRPGFSVFPPPAVAENLQPGPCPGPRPPPRMSVGPVTDIHARLPAWGASPAGGKEDGSEDGGATASAPAPDRSARALLDPTLVSGAPPPWCLSYRQWGRSAGPKPAGTP